MMKKYILFIALILQSLFCMAQLDKEFWFAPPATSSWNTSQTETHTLYFYTYDQAADIVIERYTPTPTIDTIHLPSNSHRVYTIGYYDGMTPNFSLDSLYYRAGLHVTSTGLINCCYNIRLQNQETVTLKGRSALGFDFLVPGQNVVNTLWLRLNAIGIVASQNNTTVQITAPVALTDGTAPGDTISITLQRGEVYYLKVINPSASANLTNTRIHSDKPIAVTTSDLMEENGRSVSFICEQIVPLNLWSTRYLAIGETEHDSFIGDLSNYACITASQDSTTVHVSDPDTTFMLNLGEYADIPLYQDTLIHNISADKPICVYQLSNYLGGFGSFILPNIECNGSREVTSYLVDRHAIRIVHHKYFIIANTADTSNFIINGAPMSSAEFHPVPDDTTLCYAHHSALVTDSILNIKCTSGFFTFYESITPHDYIIGSTSTCRTNYTPSSHLNFAMDSTNFCVGSEIRFHVDNLYMDSVVLWGPNSLRIENPSADFSIPAANTNQSGWYYITGQDTVQCLLSLTDSVYISVSNPFVGDIFDTIVENQLPRYHNGYEFTSAVADTTIFCSSDSSACDSVVNYHLHVYPNIFDTLDYHLCEGDLPLVVGHLSFDTEGTQFLNRTVGCHGEDSLIFVRLYIIPSSDTTIYDTIVEEQLPWFAVDTVFTDTIADYVYHTYNEAGCDSIVHYNLHIFWNGDHCDTSLSFPNVVTPNGDGKNDRFVIQGLLENQCYKYNELFIYDRTGRCIYRRQNIEYDQDWWDPAADRAPEGTYFYYFKAHGVNIRTQHRGVIEVIRGGE